MLVLGHRGASAAFPENSPAAFEGADQMGADGVELDVRIATGPGGIRLVVHHDPLPTDPVALDRLPSFHDVLDACGERMLVNVEIKNGEQTADDPTMAVVAPTIDELRRRGAGWVERVLISSFSSATLDHCRLVGPEFATALLSTPIVDSDGVSIIDLARRGGHSAVHPHHLAVDEAFVERAHSAGLTVNVWTANDPDRIAALDAIGVDGVCTDEPDVALRALGRADDGPVLSPRWARPASRGGTPA